MGCGKWDVRECEIDEGGSDLMMCGEWGRNEFESWAIWFDMVARSGWRSAWSECG